MDKNVVAVCLHTAEDKGAAYCANFLHCTQRRLSPNCKSTKSSVTEAFAAKKSMTV